MLLRKHVGGCSVAGHEWAEDGDVVEVPDQLGCDLLAIAPADYEHVLEDEPSGEPGDETPAEVEPADETPAVEVKQPNQAASAEEWKTFARAQGVPGHVVDSATRKEIVAHFNGGDTLIEE